MTNDLYDPATGFLATTSALAHARAGHNLQIAYKVWRIGHTTFEEDSTRPAVRVYDTTTGDADDTEILECETCDFAELDQDLAVEWL